MGASGAARRRVHLVTVFLRLPSGYSPGRRQTRHARIIQIGLHLTQTRSVWTPLPARPTPSDLDKKQSDGRDPPQGFAPHDHRDVVDAPELCG